MPETGIWLSDHKQRNISICQIHGGMQEWSHTVWAVGLQGLQDLVIWKFCISWWSVSSAGAGILQALQELLVCTLCRSWWSQFLQASQCTESVRASNISLLLCQWNVYQLCTSSQGRADLERFHRKFDWTPATLFSLQNHLGREILNNNPLKFYEREFNVKIKIRNPQRNVYNLTATSLAASISPLGNNLSPVATFLVRLQQRQEMFLPTSHWLTLSLADGAVHALDRTH